MALLDSDVPCSETCLAVGLQLLLYGLTNGAVLALGSVGFTLSFAAGRQINLAHGNVFALTTVFVAASARALGVTSGAPPTVRLGVLLLLLAAGALFGALLNAAVERLAFHPFRDRPGSLGPLIASAGLSFLLLGLAVRWHAATSVPAPGHQGVSLPLLAMPDLVPEVELGGGPISFTLRDALVLAFAGAVALGGGLALARTRGGRLLRASAQDAELTALCGASPDRARLLAFLAAGGLTGLGAAIYAAYYGGTSAQHGLRSGLGMMTAAFLGGIGEPIGALLGGLAIGLFSSFSDYALSAHWTPLLVLLLLIGLLAFRPAGLVRTVGSETAEPPAPAAVPVRAAAGRPLALVGLLAGGLLFGFWAELDGGARLYDATLALLLVSLALGLSVVVGLAGLLDLGYAAFFALGSYTSAVLTGSGSRLGALLPEPLREPWLALPAAGLVAAGCGLLIGLPSVRTRGQYLAVVSLAFGELVPALLLQLADWTGGARGMSGLPPISLGPLAGSARLQGYLLALALAGLGYLAVSRLAVARAGRAWAAVRDDEPAAAACGVDPVRAKLLAFVVGAGYAGLAGALFAGLFGHVEPGQFDLTVSVMVLAAVVIGGRWGFGGVVLGALLVAAYDRALIRALGAGLRQLGDLTGQPALQAADLRGDGFALFGLALYLATIARGRSPGGRAGRARSGTQSDRTRPR
jgi:branched-chain amino acid transport system permease protein